MSFEDFEDVWLHGSFPLNTAGILVLARAYKIHVTVFFNDNYWTTDAAADINKSSVFLAYRGDLEFHETRRMTTPEYEERRPLFKKLDKYYDNVHVSNALDRIKKFNECVKKHKQSKNMIESDESDITELPQESSVDPVQPKAKANVVVSNIMPTTTNEDEPVDKGYTSENSSDTPDCAKKEEPTKDEHDAKTDSSEEVDLEDILNETVDDEKNIMPNKKETDVQPRRSDRIKNSNDAASAANEDKETRRRSERLKNQMFPSDGKATEHEDEEKDAEEATKQQDEPKQKDNSANKQTDNDKDSETETENVPKKKKRKISHIGQQIQDIEPNEDDRFECPK